MNINQLLIITFLLFTYISINSNTYENFTGTVTPASCVERILNYECLDEDKKTKLNEDCSGFELYIPTGLAKISCDDKTLNDTLTCNKMLSDGACDCSYGRKQINGICNVPPINISCPPELQSRDLAIIEKLEELQEETQKCENVTRKEKELFGIASTLKNIMQGNGLLQEEDSINYGLIFFSIFIIIIVLVLFFLNKKK